MGRVSAPKRAVNANRATPGLCRRNGTYQFRKAIPLALRELAKQTEYVRSLDTRDPNKALLAYSHELARFEEFKRQLRAGVSPSRMTFRYADLERRAQKLGFDYRTAQQLSDLAERDALMARLRFLDSSEDPSRETMAAVLGEAPYDPTLSQIEEYFWTETRDRRKGMDSRQSDKARKPRERAVALFAELMGKAVPISRITPSFVREFRSRLIEWVETGTLKADTVNKYIGFLRQAVQRSIDDGKLECPNPFGSLRISEGVHKVPAKRAAFSADFIRKRIVSPGALDGMNAECRALVYAMVDSSAHLNELCGIDPEHDIENEGSCPVIHIRPNRYRTLKTNQRERIVPLVGWTLKAFEECPDGFPSYRRAGGAEAAGALINKFFKTHGISESSRDPRLKPAQTTYSFRHAYKDRLREAEIVGELQDVLMGHRTAGMGRHYGSGHTRERLYEAARAACL